MSFHQNGQHRYGHVPPAQYGAQATQNPVPGLQRQSSFDNGDDASFIDNTNRPLPEVTRPPNQRSASLPQDELYMADQNPHWQPQIRPSYSVSSPALSGYQHQYQPSATSSQPAAPATATYNPQLFTRTYSQSQGPNAPYHPVPNAPYPPSSNIPYPQQPYNTPPLGYGGHQPYNPAAYQPQATVQRQPTLSYGNSSSYVAPPPPMPQSPGYWSQTSQYGASPPVPSRPVFEHSQSMTYVPTASSAPAPPRPSPYTPPMPSAPYPTNGSYPNNAYGQRPMPMPTANSYQSSYDDQSSYSNRVSRSPSNSAPIPAEEPSTTLGRHPTLRPLPNAPVEEDTESELDEDQADANKEARAQEQIYQDIEAAVEGTASSRSRNNGDLLDSELENLHRYDSRATTINAVGVDRFPSTASTVNQSSEGAPYELDTESDPEAAAGLEAMRLAEEQDARRGSGAFGIYDSASRQSQPRDGLDTSSDSDYANIDMGLYGGGYDARMSYGDDLTGINAGNSSEMDDQSRPLPTPYQLRRSDAGHVPVPGLGGMTDYSIPGDSSIHPFPAFEQAARVDTYGTGGFQRPTSQGHRLSFDEGDEQASLGSRYTESRLSGRSGSDSPSKDDFPEMFYHPGMSTSGQRPLPAVPSMDYNRPPILQPAGSYRNAQYGHQYGSQVETRTGYPPDGPDAYPSPDLLSPVGQFVPRSASLSSHSNTPQVIPPVRSRTDAEERQARIRAFRQQQGLSNASLDGFDAATPQSSIPLDLPALPLGRRRKISPQNLRSSDFKKCKEPWALSSVAEWAKEMCGGETGDGESDLREKTVAECLVALFTHKVPTMNTADAETLSDRVVNTMLETGVLIRDEEWVKFGQGEISGVMWQLTGFGCYAPKLHEQEIHGRCYSHHCGRTLKKINLSVQEFEPSKKSEDWIAFFNVTKEQIDSADKKEVQRQFNLHEIVMSEDKYMDRLNVLRVLYRDALQSWQPPIIATQRLPRFIQQVFGKVEAIKKANEEHLLAQLKYRQQEQGPWIIGFSDVFREWIRKARQVYMEYAAGFPNATYSVRREAEKNILFRQFLDQARENKLSDRLDWNTYLFAPLKRLQQYTLLLREVQKHTFLDNDEKANLAVAIEEINTVTLECDAKVDEMAKKVEMMELSHKLQMRPGMERVELNLDHLGRELIFKGDLQRAGANRFTWLEIHALLFDHYLVMAKTVKHGDPAAGRKKETYDVSKLPIPMELLVLESTNDDVVVKSSVKGLGAVTTKAPATATDPRLSRTNTNGERSTPLEHTNTNTSISTMNSATKTVTSTNLDDNAKSMFPFRIRHLGRSEVYTLYAPTAQNRQDWCEKIIEAKERHARSLFAQNAEPFRLKVMADTAFVYDVTSAVGKVSGIPIRGTPLDRAIRDMEKEYGGARQAPVCRAVVNCATAFACYGKSMVAIGTDYGVYIAEASNPRGWTRSIQMNRVTQIDILEDFSLCLIIADKALIAYHLDVIVPVSNFPALNQDSPRRAPQKLSGAKDVGFFATARMKDRTLVFYKKREGLSSTFKVLEPVLQKSTEKKSKLFGRGRLSGGATEFFREFDEFYIPAECFTMNLFHTYISVSTQRGFELLTLDKKVTLSIPDLKQPSIANIAARLSGQKPLGMFRKSDTEFLLCYEECGVYIDKHGEVSRSVVLEFIGKAKSAAMYGAYLVLFDNDFVEVRNAENGRLRQVIAGKDVRCIDYGVPGAGQGGQRTLKLAMAHPEMAGSQLVLEMVLNDGQRE